MDTRTVSMEIKGVMQEIRDMLAQGKSAAEVIALGYKPPTVYKVQRCLNRKGQSDAIALRQTGAPAPASSVDPQVLAALQAKNAELEQWRNRLLDDLAEADQDRFELYEAEERSEAEKKSLEDRVKTLETEAAAAGQLRQRVRELEGQLQHASHAQAAMRQGTLQLQGSVHAERASHQITKAQANAVSQENKGLHGKLDEWRQWGANAQSVIQSLTAEIEQLRPLKVWVGHPCAVCRKPLPGIVSREDAAKAMKDFGHKDCLDKQKSGLGKLLLAGGALYGLSRLR